MVAKDPFLPFASAAAFETWLDANHATSGGLWLKIAKAGSGIASVTYAEALQRALDANPTAGEEAAEEQTAPFFWASMSLYGVRR